MVGKPPKSEEAIGGSQGERFPEVDPDPWTFSSPALHCVTCTHLVIQAPLPPLALISLGELFLNCHSYSLSEICLLIRGMDILESWFLHKARIGERVESKLGFLFGMGHEAPQKRICLLQVGVAQCKDWWCFELSLILSDPVREDRDALLSPIYHSQWEPCGQLPLCQAKFRRMKRSTK